MQNLTPVTVFHPLGHYNEDITYNERFDREEFSMTNTFHLDQTVGHIAAIFPRAINIFMNYQIDFCCGGDRQLSVALGEKNIEAASFLAELELAYERYQELNSQERDHIQMPSTELMEYIVDKHHTFMKEEMPLVDQLLNKILKVHYVDHREVLSPLHQLFSKLKGEIEEHLVKEEELLFPSIRDYEENPTEENLQRVLSVMEETESEHDVAGDVLKQMREVSYNYTPPQGACRTFVNTYEKLEAIEKDLFHHVHLENNILFKRYAD